MNSALQVFQGLPRVEMLDVPIARATMEEALGCVEQAVRQRQRLRIGVVNAAKLVNMRRDPLLRADVLSSDVILADGMSVVWASRLLLGRGLPERITGIDLMLGVLERGRAHGLHVYLLGARPDVLAEASERICRQFPGVRIVGRQHGYFSEHEEPEIVSSIRAAEPDVLFVAISSPRKERFMAEWADQLDVPVVHGVGGSFDVLAGRVRRAPELWRRLGCEWLYRLAQEPRRLWRRYLVTNSVFIGLVARGFLTRVVRRRPGFQGLGGRRGTRPDDPGGPARSPAPR